VRCSKHFLVTMLRKMEHTATPEQRPVLDMPANHTCNFTLCVKGFGRHANFATGCTAKTQHTFVVWTAFIQV
jgi:hypothetical protein